MNKKYYLLTAIISVATLIGGYLYGKQQAEREFYLTFMSSSAVESVLPTQVLYAINSNKAQNSKIWLENEICSNLIIIEGGLKQFPKLRNNAIIQDTLAMPKLCAKDFDVSFCGSDFKDIEQRALSMANDFPDSYNHFLEKYRKIK